MGLLLMDMLCRSLRLNLHFGSRPIYYLHACLISCCCGNDVVLWDTELMFVKLPANSLAQHRAERETSFPSVYEFYASICVDLDCTSIQATRSQQKPRTQRR